MPTATRPVDSACGCDERDLAASRRGFLRAAALVGTTTVFGSTVVTMDAGEARAAGAKAASVVVVLSLRGAADGLSLVVPHGDPAYYAGRPTIAVPAASLLAPDSFFGLHPALAPLLPLWQAGRLAAVHATGLPVANRSHFSAMEEVEEADPGSASRVGWLNRLIGADAGRSSLQGLAVGSTIPASLLGPEPAMSMRGLETVGIPGDGSWDRQHTRIRSLDTQWRRVRTPLGAGFREALDAVDGLETAARQPDHQDAYPDSPLGEAMSSIAQTLRADIGVSAVTVDSGNWDMHVGVGTARGGWMVDNATDLAGCVAAFFADLGSVADKVTLVTISEFGRRVQENANRGLDHGWGNVMLVAGAGVKGGRYYGTWPVLADTLDADVPVTTDYRSVLAEVIAARTTASTAAVFPGFQRERVGFMVGQ